MNVGSLSKQQKKEYIYKYFIEEAKKQNAQHYPVDIATFFDPDSDKKKLAIVMPESIGDVFLATALLESAKSVYPDYLIYFITKPEYFTILEANPYIHKCVPFHPSMENLLAMEGQGEHKGVVDICFLPYLGTQRTLNYLHNGQDKIVFPIH